MSQGQRCPNRDALEAFLHGDMDAGAWEQLAAHIETCASCLQTVEMLSGHHKLAGVVRSAGWELGPADQQQIQGLLERLRVVCAAPAFSETITHPSVDTPSMPSDQAPTLDFLGPPEGPDEIGRLGGYRILA